ncbi:MAG: HTH domain-containing protein, partial [Anaerolineae bacterium]|nr:HTH domain-containing protein [Anaerolineae bacterium]
MSIDDAQLPELTRRQEAILSLIIRAYTEMPEPISSKSLVEKLDVSSATIRNDMQVLEQL